MRSIIAVLLISWLVTPLSAAIRVNERAEHIRSLVVQYEAGRYSPPTTAGHLVGRATSGIQQRYHNSPVDGDLTGTSPGRLYTIYHLVAREAGSIGISPAVVAAIEAHESASWSSRLWLDGYNPGGIEYREFPGIDCWRNPRRPRWAAFSSAEDGIRAHAIVLSNRRYNGARMTSDPYAQIEAIARAGYCEMPWRAGWIAGVKRHLRRISGAIGEVLAFKPKPVQLPLMRYYTVTYRRLN